MEWSVHNPLDNFYNVNPLSVGIFTVFFTYQRLLEGRVLHKEAWVGTLLGTLLGVQDYKTVEFPGRDIQGVKEILP